MVRNWQMPFDSYLIGKVARLAVGYVRDPGIWLMKRRGRHRLCDVAAQAKATLIINLIIVSSDKRPSAGEARLSARPNQPVRPWLATAILTRQ